MVPDALRTSIMTGRLNYKDQITMLSGRKAELQAVYRKIIDNYVSGRVFGSYNVDLIDTQSISLVIANEKKFFYAALSRIKRSGAVAGKFPGFEICSQNYKSEDKAMELFKDSVGDSTELEWKQA